MVDKMIILRKLSDLDQYLAQLKEFSDISVEKYSDDWKAQRIVERTLQIMIETCLDISGHIISDEGFRTPESYSDMFKILLENRILKKKLSESMEKMAKFRNYVVHHYDRIDSGIIVSMLHKNLDDFTEFKKSIILYLKQVGAP
jgi:uncharacterized protein YutE (UPF0331/DUF86 family)